MTATTTTTRPVRPAGTTRTRAPAPPDNALVAGGRAGAVAAVLGLLLLSLPVLAVLWGEDRAGAAVPDALRWVAHLWLVAHGVALDLPGGRLGLTPLGLSVLPAWLCWRAGGRAAAASGAASLADALRVAVAVALVYGGLAVVVTLASGRAGLEPVLWTALVGPPLLAVAAASAGALRRLPAGQLPALPARVVPVLRTATAAALLLLAAGALLVAVALTRDGGSAAELAGAAQPGAVGGLGLLLLGVSVGPNVAVWGASYLAGPGFALGVGTAVGPFGVALGPVPAMPLVAALPGGAPPTTLAVLALAVPVAAGVLAGRAFASTAGRWYRAVLDAAATGLLAGGVIGLLAALSGGPLGGERLAAVGPSPWQVGAAVAGQIAVGALAGALLRRRGA